MSFFFISAGKDENYIIMICVINKIYEKEKEKGKKIMMSVVLKEKERKSRSPWFLMEKNGKERENYNDVKYCSG